MARIGGKLTVAVNGARISCKGGWKINPGVDKRESVVGQDGVHGYKEMPQVPSIEGNASVTPATDVKQLLAAKDATVTLDAASGHTYVLRDAVQTAEGVVDTEEGELPLRFEGLSMEIKNP